MNLINKVLDLIKDTKVNVVDIKQQILITAKELNYGEDILAEVFSLIEEAEGGRDGV